MNSIHPQPRPDRSDRTRSNANAKARPDEQRRAPLMRRYECLSQDAQGLLQQQTIVAPALPVFETAFSAFARGTVLKTTDGNCPIEDLEPGMMLETADFGPLPILWRGAMNIVPNTPTDHPESQQLARIMQGSFGLARPATDLMLGPAAQVVRPAGNSPNQWLQPIADLVDGHTVFRTSPPSAAQVFHLCLPRQASLLANGVQLASYHPPLEKIRLLGPNMKQLFLSFFPHVQDLQDFGAALQMGPERVRDAELDWV